MEIYQEGEGGISNALVQTRQKTRIHHTFTIFKADKNMVISPLMTKKHL